MTNLVDKQKLLASLDMTREALALVSPSCELLAQMGAPEALAANKAYIHATEALTLGILCGKFDYEPEQLPPVELDILVVYTEEDLDTEDMDDYAPEEEPARQDDLIGGIIHLGPAESPEERAELVEFYQSLGFEVKQ